MILYRTILLTFFIIHAKSSHADKNNNNDHTANNTTQNEEYKSRIAGGVLARISDFPYVAFLFPKMCGGNILSERWILSIHYCNARRVTVLVGVDTIEGRTEGDYYVQYSLRHQSLDGNELYDLMLFRTNRPLEFNENIQPIAIGVPEDIFDQNLATIAGFGEMEEDMNSTEITTLPFLQVVKIPIATNQKCAKRYPRLQTLLSGNSNNNFCAGYNAFIVKLGGQHSFCKADLGSGLVVGAGKDRRLVGVAVKIEGCGHWDDAPGIYASVPFAKMFLLKFGSYQYSK